MKKILLMIFPIILLAGCGQLKQIVNTEKQNISGDKKTITNNTNIDSGNFIPTSGADESGTKEAMKIINQLLK